MVQGGGVEAGHRPTAAGLTQRGGAQRPEQPRCRGGGRSDRRSRTGAWRGATMKIEKQREAREDRLQLHVCLGGK